MTSKLNAKGLVSSQCADEPFGVLARNGCVEWVCVVHVCELPLQADTYHEIFANPEPPLPGLPSLQGWGKLMLAFSRIRGYGQSTSVHWPSGCLDAEVLDDFRERLRGATSSSCLVVALGRVAEAACRKAAAREETLAANGPEIWQYMKVGACAPHPARNQWEREPDQVTCMLEKVAEHLCDRVDD